MHELVIQLVTINIELIIHGKAALHSCGREIQYSTIPCNINMTPIIMRLNKPVSSSDSQNRDLHHGWNTPCMRIVRVTDTERCSGAKGEIP